MDTVPSFDLYRELEVDHAATAETIDAAWRSLVKRHHPDVAPDRQAAYEKIKRLNVAHEWLADRRLREMYDLTRLRRRHAQVTFDETARQPVAAADGRRYRGSALVSTAVVAILAAAAFGSIALNQSAVQQGSAASPTAPMQSATANVGGVAGATSALPLPAPSSAVAGAVSSLVPDDPPAFELPDGCVADQRLEVRGDIDAVPAWMFFFRCGAAGGFGPQVYRQDGPGWTELALGRFERAIPVAAGFGSITGHPNEYWVAWANPDGVTWLAIYRIEGDRRLDVWHSLSKDRPPERRYSWVRPQVIYVANQGPAGRIEVRHVERGQAYLEVYALDTDGIDQTYRQPAGG